MTDGLNPTQFGQNLLIALSGLNLSRGALAQQLGVDKSVVSCWATGQSRPSETSLTRLTGLIRQNIANFSRHDWMTGSEELSRRLGIASTGENGGPTGTQPSSSGGRLRLEGLRGLRDAANASLYTGLWAGFFHTSEP